MKRWLAAAIVAVIAIAAGWAGYRWYKQRHAPTGTTIQTAAVTRGSFVKTVSATGNLAPSDEVTLSFDTDGTVAQVLARAGDQLTANQPIAALDTRKLELSLSAAEADLAASQSSLASAQASLAQLEAGPDADARENAKIDLETAKDRLWSTQMQRDATCGRYKNKTAQKVDCDTAQSSVLQAEGAERQAEIAYEQAIAGPSETDLMAARDKVTQAKAQLASAEVQADQARISLQSATLASPITGTLTSLDVKVGQVVPSAQTVATVSDLDSFTVDISVAESDIGDVRASQAATVTLDAFPGETLSGKVTDISLVANVQSGVVLFPVTVSVDPGDVPARPGMTANVDIVTVSEADALLVPIRAVNTTDQGAYVMRLTTSSGAPFGGSGAQPGGPRSTRGGGTPAAGTPGAGGAPGGSFRGTRAAGAVGTPPTAIQTRIAAGGSRRGSSAQAGTSGSMAGTFVRTPVTIGAENDTYVVIRSGLSEGDIVQVAAVAASSSSNQRFGGGPPGGNVIIGGFGGRP